MARALTPTKSLSRVSNDTECVQEIDRLTGQVNQSAAEENGRSLETDSRLLNHRYSDVRYRS
jgi:hypothetical protein